jgi:hypothetical protein
MKVLELLEQKQESTKGTYAAVKFDDKTVAALQKYIKDNDIPNGTPAEKMHCTVLYSRKHCPDYKPAGEIDPPWTGTPDKLEVWESNGKLRDKPTTRCLVMKFKCEELNARHKELMDEHDATYDFPEYKTHITLSYDIGDMDEDKLPNIKDAIGEIKVVNEYGEDLDMSWSDKLKKDE